MAGFDQFANQGGPAAGDPEEAAAAQAQADELLKSANEADSADFGGGPLGSHAEHDGADEAEEAEAADEAESEND